MTADGNTIETRIPDGIKNITSPTDYEKDANDVINNFKEFYKNKEEFLKQRDTIKQLGTEDEKKEYEEIVDKIIMTDEPKIEDLLKKMNINKVDIQIEQYNSMPDKKIKEIADNKMLSQPEKVDMQKKLLQKINNYGSQEDINQLIEIVNNSKKEIGRFLGEFYKNGNRNISSNNSVDYTVPGEHEAGSVPTQSPEGEKTNPGGHTAPGPEREGSAVPGTQSPEGEKTNSVDYTAPGKRGSGHVPEPQRP